MNKLALHVNNISEMSFTEDKHLIQTLVFDTPYKPLCKGIHIRTRHGSLYTLNATCPQDTSKVLSKQWIPVMDQELLVP